VQCQTRCAGIIGNLRGTKRAPVFDVSTEWQSEFGQLNADLVGAASFQSAFKFAEPSEASEGADMGNHGKPPFRIFVAGRTPQPIAPITNLNGPQSLCGKFLRDDTEVTAMHRVCRELADQLLLGGFGSSKDDDPAGFTVNSVNDFEGLCCRLDPGASFALEKNPGQSFIERWLALFLLR
jgi:hypothetical protein